MNTARHFVERSLRREVSHYAQRAFLIDPVELERLFAEAQADALRHALDQMDASYASRAALLAEAERLHAGAGAPEGDHPKQA